jgi:hypothetical protein
MDPLTIGAIITGVGTGLNAYGNYRGAQEQAKANQAATANQQRMNFGQVGQDDRQFAQTANMNRAGYLDQRAGAAADMRRRANLTPLADRASAMLAARAGAAPAAFQARDFTRGTTPGAGQATGGYSDVLGAMQRAGQGYTPGSGGMANPELEAAIARLTSMAGVPGEYSAQSPMKTQLESALAEQMMLLGQTTKADDRMKIQQRINQIRAQLAQLGGGQGAGAQGGSQIHGPSPAQTGWGMMQSAMQLAQQQMRNAPGMQRAAAAASRFSGAPSWQTGGR